MKPTNTLQAMTLDRKVPFKNRVTRLAGSTTNTVIKILTPYAMYQAAAHDTISPDIAQAIIERVGNGTINTLQDAGIVIQTLLENFPAIKSNILYEILGSIDEPTFENPPFQSLGGQEEPSFNDLKDATGIVRKTSGAIEKDAGHAWNNMLNASLETFSAMISVLAGSWIGRKTIGTLALKDNPGLGQRLRFGFFNLFRGKKTSRKIDIPSRGGDKFTRK